MYSNSPLPDENQITTYILTIEIDKPYEALFIPSGLDADAYCEILENDGITSESQNTGSTLYFSLLSEWIGEILDGCVRMTNEFDGNGTTISYNIQPDSSEKIVIHISSNDPSSTLKFTETVARIFSSEKAEEYKLIGFGGIEFLEKIIRDGSIPSLGYKTIIHTLILMSLPFVFNYFYEAYIGYFVVFYFIAIGFTTYFVEKKYFSKRNERINKMKSTLQKIQKINEYKYVYLPEELCNGEDKRMLFYGKKQKLKKLSNTREKSVEDWETGVHMSVGAGIACMLTIYLVYMYEVNVIISVLFITFSFIIFTFLSMYLGTYFDKDTESGETQRKQLISGKIKKIKPNDTGILVTFRTKIEKLHLTES